MPIYYIINRAGTCLRIARTRGLGEALANTDYPEGNLAGRSWRGRRRDARKRAGLFLQLQRQRLEKRIVGRS
jgi:hypothetical protein